jgi:Antitoxin FitA-like, ribbon-helix-helix
MPDLLVRNVDPKTTARLKELARAHKRSLQAELRDILERAAQRPRADWKKGLERLDRLFEGTSVPDSTEMLRQDREGH